MKTLMVPIINPKIKPIEENNLAKFGSNNDKGNSITIKRIAQLIAQARMTKLFFIEIIQDSSILLKKLIFIAIFLRIPKKKDSIKG